ncbi:calcineurin-like phosphoesterase C-terminal domain-containing protein [Myroides sp. LJL119]
MRFYCIVIFLFFSSFCLAQNSISGIVYLDLNDNNQWDQGEPGIKDVVISNGQDITTTNDFGEYKIQTIPDATVFLIQPKGMSTKLGDYNISQFYIDYNKVNTIEKYDFALKKSKQDTYQIALLGDMQVDVSDDIDHIEKLVVSELFENKPDLIFPLGDISFDNLNIFSSVAQSLALIQKPVYYVIGNHDLDFNRPVYQRDYSFRNVFGPSYYALEYGQELFIVLNNILPTDENKYKGSLDLRQKKFLKNILNHYSDKNKALRIIMHIPLEYMDDKKEILTLVDSYTEVMLISGHTHTQYHRYYPRENKKAVHQLVGGALCGSWWQGPHDLEGIPLGLMYDGTPKGYWYLNKNASEQTFLSYKVSGLSEKQQMHIWVPSVKQWDTLKNQLNEPYIYANVFAGDQFTQVQITLDGENWWEMERFLGVDPFYRELSLLQQTGRYESLKSAPISKAQVNSEHLWRFQIPQDLPKGKYIIQVRAKNAKVGIDHQSFKIYNHI